MFGDLSQNTRNYPVKKLSDIADYWNGLTYKPSDAVESDAGTLVLRSSNIQNGELVFEDNVFVNCAIKEKLYVQDNDILMCSRNGSAALVGKTALIKGLKEPTTFGAFMMIIRSKYYPYLKTYFELPFFRNQISTGTSTINQITGKMLNDIQLPVPDMEAVSQFENFVHQSDKSKFTGFKSQFIEMFGDPAINSKGLPIAKLPELGENLDNKRIPITGGNRKAGEYPYYGASGIVDYVADYIFDDDLLLISEDGANLVARVTPIAFSSTGKVWINNHAHVIKFKSMAMQCYVENLLNMMDISPYVTGTAQPKLNQAKLNSIPIPVPAEGQIREYLEFVKQSDKSK